MFYIDGKVWGGGRDGTIYIINAQHVTIEQTLELHKDRIRSMCLTDTSFILTGPGSSDGRIAVWRTHFLAIVDNGDGFEFLEKNIVKASSTRKWSKRK
ncbi:hypothetical protein QZH41_014702 [Actinostola sp. cb2023]|nr:hypothetical protein QZH41_014702 [Actinostola sp. cb2023]